MHSPYTQKEMHLVNYAPILNELPHISHGFFTRKGGVSKGIYNSLNCGLGSKDERTNVLQNRAFVAGMLGFSAGNLVANAQIHSKNVVTVTQSWLPENAPQADGLVTNVPNLLLCAAGADCGVILFADESQKIIGACHAGWRGAVAGILEKTIVSMEALGANRSTIRASLGPTISQMAYEVGNDVYTQVLATSPWAENCFIKNPENSQKYMFNLPFYIENRLKLAKITQFHDMNLCTYSNPEQFFSYRRATHLNEPDYGRHLHGIGILAGKTDDI